MTFLASGWDWVRCLAWGAGGGGLLGLSGQFTDPIAQIVAAIGGCAMGLAALYHAHILARKLNFRMKHYKNPQALKAVPAPGSDDDTDATPPRPSRPRPRSPRRKSKP